MRKMNMIFIAGTSQHQLRVKLVMKEVWLLEQDASVLAGSE